MAVALERLQAGRLARGADRARVAAPGEGGYGPVRRRDRGLPGGVAPDRDQAAAGGPASDRGRGRVHVDRDRRPDPGVRRTGQLLLVVLGPRQQCAAGRVARDRPSGQHPAAARHAAGQARHHALAVRDVLLPLAAVPIAIATVPLLLERMLANTAPNWWETSFHYNAFLVVVLVCAAADGAARLDRWIARARQRLAARREQPAEATAAAADATPAPEADASPASLATSRPPGRNGRAGVCRRDLRTRAVPGPAFRVRAALHRQFYHRNARMEAAAAADAVVPSGVTVEAVPYLGPSCRRATSSCCGTATAELPDVRAVGGREHQAAAVQLPLRAGPEAARRAARARRLQDRLPPPRLPCAAPARPAGAEPPITQGTSTGRSSGTPRPGSGRSPRRQRLPGSRTGSG